MNTAKKYKNPQKNSIFQRISDFYRKNSIQYMLSLSFTSIAIIGIVFIVSALFIRFSSVSEKTTAENNQRIVEQVNLNLDFYLRSMMQISNSMYYSVIKNADFATDNIESQLGLLYDTNRDFIISLAVFNEKGQLIAASPAATLKKNINPLNEGWFIAAESQIENLHFSTPHVQNLFEDSQYRYKWVVSLSRAAELTTDGAIEGGVLLLDMNFSGIEQICRNVNLGDGGYIYLADRDGEIIYHPRQQLIYSSLLAENNHTDVRLEDGSHTTALDGKSRIVTVKTLGYTGWKIIGVSPVSNISASLFDYKVFMVFTLILTILLLIFANSFISAKIADPIKALESSVRELEDGSENVNIAIGGSYEIAHLGKTIKDMVDQMHKLMRNIVIEQELKRKSESDALQAQINPHFLYNTLDSIVWMVENERYQEAISMVTSLAGFFRIGLSKGKNIISVADELAHARNYITIQHMRFKDKFTFSINAEKETLNLAIIKLVIQPIIENAVYHGMEFMDGDGEITVNSYIKEGDLFIDVVDNGPGMTEACVEGLLTRESVSRGKGSGIGLKNVQERIRLYFGDEYGLTILSEPDEGTTVRIHMPCVPISEIYSEGNDEN